MRTALPSRGREEKMIPMMSHLFELLFEAMQLQTMLVEGSSNSAWEDDPGVCLGTTRMDGWRGKAKRTRRAIWVR